MAGQASRWKQKNHGPPKTRNITKVLSFRFFLRAISCPLWLSFRRRDEHAANQAALAELVEAAEAGVAFLAHVALEDRGIGMTQIDDHQAIDHVGKFAVEIEAH